MEGPEGPSMTTPIYYVGLACSPVLWVLCARAPQSHQSIGLRCSACLGVGSHRASTRDLGHVYAKPKDP